MEDHQHQVAQSSITTSTDQNTDVTRASRKDHIGCDVAMGGDSADENSAAHTPVGVRQQKEDHNEERTT